MAGGSPKYVQGKPTHALLKETVRIGHDKALKVARELERKHPSEAHALEERIKQANEALGLRVIPTEPPPKLGYVLQQAADAAVHEVPPVKLLTDKPIPESLKTERAKERRNRRLGSKPKQLREDYVPDDVAPKKLRVELRHSLQKKLEGIKREMEIARNERARASEKIRALNKERANPTTSALEAPQARSNRIEAELEAAREELRSAQVGDDLGIDYLRINNLLEATEKDYFNALTSAAAKEASYQRVAKMGHDEVCGIGSTNLAVDHVYPRSRIFLLTDFEKVPWEMQIEMFAFEGNLKLMDAGANSSRGAKPYARISPEFLNRYNISPSVLADLVTQEKRMEQYFEQWIKTRRKPAYTP